MANKKNFGTSTVLTAPSPATSGTSLVVQSGHGARFPAAPFYATVHPDNTLPTLDNAEVVYVSAKSTDTFTITRAQKETTGAISITTGMRISNAIFREDVDNVSIIRNEVPGGSVNGSNTVFTTASIFASGSLRVYLNGIRLKGGGADYTEDGGLQSFTTVTAPLTGTVLLVDYEVCDSTTQVGTNSFVGPEVPSGSVNSSNTVFTTARAYIGGSTQVWLNGVLQRPTTDYVETTPSSGTITFTSAPSTGDSVLVVYQYNLNSSSNADTVDGVHANTTATANQLFPLNASAKVPVDVFGTGAQAASVATSESTSSTSYADLATTTDTVTVTIGTNGLALVIVSGHITNNTTANIGYISFAASGANTIAASDTRAFFEGSLSGLTQGQGSWAYLATGLSTGSTTFKMKYRTSANSCAFENRVISVIPL